ncbi:unnamed protein product [Trichobilharzia regenti]|nr:unnamed protein product [Trichobilharzia regenti]
MSSSHSSLESISHNIKSTCLKACYTAQSVYSRSDQLQNSPSSAYCPKLDTWPESCQYTCQNDSDCLPYGYTKCCQTTKCFKISQHKRLINHTKNVTKFSVCSQGVYNPKGECYHDTSLYCCL